MNSFVINCLSSPALVLSLLAGSFAFNAVAAPVKGGTLIYLEQQAQTSS
jgi:peptide/nickel transport system substrate-binding protein